MAIVSEIDYPADQTKCFLDKLYEGNVKSLVTTLIQSDTLTPEDCEELKAFWQGIPVSVCAA